VSKRLTDIELRRAEVRLREISDPEAGSPLAIAIRSISEIRRLRKLIANIAAPFPEFHEPVDRRNCCYFCGANRGGSIGEPEPHNGSCAWPALESEADALEAEATPLDSR